MNVNGAKQKTTEKFIEDAIKKHGDKFEYNNTVYTGCYNEVLVTCKLHGDFPIVAYSHLNGNGCKECKKITLRKLHSSNTEEFIEKAKKIHGDRYDYSLVDYISTHKNVWIICKEHEPFPQQPHHHLIGCGCPICGWECNPFRKGEWRLKNQENLATFYILRCFNETESFYKYGVTLKGIKIRYQNKSRMPYEYEIVRQIQSYDREYIWSLEKRFGRFKRKDRYSPLIPFDGSFSECFTVYNKNPNRR